MDWSTTARNIGSMIEGKTVRNAGFCALATATNPVAPLAAGFFGSSVSSCKDLGPESRNPAMRNRANRPGKSSSMRHQDRQGGICQDVTRGSAEHHLPQAALRVGAFDQQIAALFHRIFKSG